jgi:hypothetical protein
MFDRPANVSMRTPEELDTPAFRKVVRESAEQSIVREYTRDLPLLLVVVSGLVLTGCLWL